MKKTVDISILNKENTSSEPLYHSKFIEYVLEITGIYEIEIYPLLIQKYQREYSKEDNAPINISREYKRYIIKEASISDATIYCILERLENELKLEMDYNVYDS